MNLGELYYFDKILDNNITSLDQIEILGVDLTQDGLTPVELLNKYKDTFIDNFSQLLKENGQIRINYIWNRITDVFVVSGSKINTDITTDDNLIIGIMNLINDWIDTGQKIDDLDKVLKEVEVIASNSLPAFSLYYGLRVLHFISVLLLKYNKSNFLEDVKPQVDQSDFDPFSISQKDIVLGVCPSTLAGLFNSSGIETLTNIDDVDNLINAIEGKLHKQPDLKLLITLGVDELILNKIEKRFSNKIIVCPIPENTTSNSKKNYFAELALKTIGLPELALKN